MLKGAPRGRASGATTSSEKVSLRVLRPTASVGGAADREGDGQMARRRLETADCRPCQGVGWG
jgi:hypothetical protein